MRSTVAAAVRMTLATVSGWETMITCEPSASVIVAPARSAMERITSVPARQARVGGGVRAKDEPRSVPARLDLAALAAPAACLGQRPPNRFDRDGPNSTVIRRS